MYDSQEVDLDFEEEADTVFVNDTSCSQGHRSSLNLRTQLGGSICLLCFSNLVSNPLSPTVHVSYALSQIERSLSHPPFLLSVLAFHPQFLLSPLVAALSSFDDEPIAAQIIRLIVNLCASNDPSVRQEFVGRVFDRIASGTLAWSSRQLHMIHCLGVLLNCENDDLIAHIRDVYGLITILVTGLQLPSDEIRGEILFVLYKLYALKNTSTEGDDTDILVPFCPTLLYLLGDVLMKSQNDDVRLNCIALLTMLAQGHLLREEGAYDTCHLSYSDGADSEENIEGAKELSLVNLLAEAIKGPLLSSNSQVQISTLDLLFHYLSSIGTLDNQIHVMVEENIADYVFEVLRYSVLHYVAEVPFHPAQYQTLKLIYECISECPGAVSSSQMEELVLVLIKMLKKNSNGEMGMTPDTFIMACSVFVVLIRSPSCNGDLDLPKSVEDAVKHAALSCICISERDINQILQCLYLLKEAYAYSHDGNTINSSKLTLRSCILDICRTHLLPWLVSGIHEMEEEIVLAVLETFHLILLHSSNDAMEFAESLISSSWFSFSFGCLGLFTGDRMKYRVYLLLSSLIDSLQGNDSGQPIRDAALDLPSDPVDLVFLLGQRRSNNLNLSSCQTAILLIMYTRTLYDIRIADEKLVLASLEQYILLNGSDFHDPTKDNLIVTQLVNLYGLLRGLGKMNHGIHYSREAEEILFRLIKNDEWDLLSGSIHTVSLRWLFQQENIVESLGHQILAFCRSYNLEGGDIIIGNIYQTIDVQTLAELVSEKDNYGARLFICLLAQLFEEEGQEHDVISVLNLMATLIHICPAASDQLSLHGIGSTIRTWCYSSNTFSETTFMSILLLVFNILSSVHPEALSADQSWIAVTMKMMEYFIPPENSDVLSNESLFAIGILSMILHLSTSKALEEASKTILFNTSIISVVNTAVCAAASKGPALVDHDEGTSTGETLIFVLLLHYFAIRRVSNQINNTHEELKCSVGYLMSIKSILEGLVFYDDARVATNCAVCLSMLLRWEKLENQTKLHGKSNWCRMIMEEMTASLVSPRLASPSLAKTQRPAIHIDTV
ncbi:protein PRD1-like isoform X2 [Arachis ipaensis]|uniref:protein PRD1-like isoform X2 n=1 Tax=Arachis ipaensis TaxID=130454 RepID=UPI000A2B98F0|nr:protein PRD1-like isoform X2 [Arachis ipaensis]